jgi:hypothetical protein
MEGTQAMNDSQVAAHAAMDPGRLIHLSMGFWAPKAFLSAVELGVFGSLVGGAKTADALVADLGLHGRGARDFFDTLVALGLLERDSEGRYSNGAEAALYLDPARPTYLGHFFRMIDQRLYEVWGKLSDALRTGCPQNEGRDGKAPFEALYADPDRLKLFIQAMSAISAPQADALAENFAWKQVRSVADIGAAEGGLLARVLAANPHMTGIGFDLPPVRPHFDALMERFGVSSRARFETGDFFAAPLPEAEVIVMGHILHDWNLEQKQTLVRKAFAALPSNGWFLINEMMIDNERRTPPGLLMSLNMLLETPGGYDFTPAECEQWMSEAGFVDIHFQPMPGAHTLAIARKP